MRQDEENFHFPSALRRCRETDRFEGSQRDRVCKMMPSIFFSLLLPALCACMPERSRDLDGRSPLFFCLSGSHASRSRIILWDASLKRRNTRKFHLKKECQMSQRHNKALFALSERDTIIKNVKMCDHFVGIRKSDARKFASELRGNLTKGLFSFRMHLLT